MISNMIQKEKFLNYNNIELYDDYWGFISSQLQLTPEFIEKYFDKFKIFDIITNQKLSENFLYSHKKDMTSQMWEYDIPQHQDLSMNFIINNDGSFCYSCLAMNQKLTESYIIEHIDKFRFSDIIFSQKVSEDFLRKYKDKINWRLVACKQVLSESFIEEFADKLNFDLILKHQDISEEFTQEIKDKWL